MSEFLIFFELGLKHILNIYSYDHVLFLIGLAVPFSFKDWQRILLLVTLFTIGHSMALLLVVFGIVAIKVSVVEMLIPITILIVALFNLFTAGKTSKKESINIIFFVTLFFGIIHGLGFSSYFKAILPGGTASKLLPLAEFSLGIEAAQLVIIVVTLILSYIVQTFFRFSKRDWTLVMSAFIIGVVIPLIVTNKIWLR
ncbi:HupE / UreJ protein [Flavobacterium faecale]|uniref:HupE / UreJ protein n=1 Tax=Flavobacterium faecale TaxID=1355330 RepID=A0A2S1LBM7_9FLAO|nr:HupE/UreJ family protein [Flavobacterium faecale]AWG21150.1 HupE / UreJ protein [Flavobacterium faecale]